MSPGSGSCRTASPVSKFKEFANPNLFTRASYWLLFEGMLLLYLLLFSELCCLEELGGLSTGKVGILVGRAIEGFFALCILCLEANWPIPLELGRPPPLSS